MTPLLLDIRCVGKFPWGGAGAAAAGSATTWNPATNGGWFPRQNSRFCGDE
jgi:hypothetical protein